MNVAWLSEFHRQWQAARGGKLKQGVVVFSRGWEALLESAGLHTAEERKLAEHEARTLADAGRFKVVLHRHRHLRRLQLPLDQEPWLQSWFGSPIANEVLAHAQHVIAGQRERSHPRYPDEWSAWCNRIAAEFAMGRNLRPLFWRKPDAIALVMDLVRDLTAKDWPPFTLVRDADVLIGRATKTIERYQHVIEASMSQLFLREMTLDGLGIVSSNSEMRFHGSLTLHFADGTEQAYTSGLYHHSLLTAADLERAQTIATSAHLILSVENRKTTFRHLVAANREHRALVIATSFPTRAVIILLQKLPFDLPHNHFGDTDPAGYFILHKLRQLDLRHVRPLSMDWQDDPTSPALSFYDQQVIAKLLAEPGMMDCHENLRRMSASGHRGNYEQEGRPLPSIDKK